MKNKDIKKIIKAHVEHENEYKNYIEIFLKSDYGYNLSYDLKQGSCLYSYAVLYHWSKFMLAVRYLNLI